MSEQAEPQVVLSLPVSAVNAILVGLGKLPLEAVRELDAFIRTEAQKQLEEKKEVVESTDEAA